MLKSARTSDRTPRTAPNALCLALVLGTAILPPLAAGQMEERQQVDTRRAYSASSPNWLRAVGKLRVPGIKIRNGERSNYLEDCSASLVSRVGSDRADTIITAWHCLEYYSDLSKSITFTLLPDSKNPISTEVSRLADGGGMWADWAILRLHRPIPAQRVSALGIHPGITDPKNNIIMAGYSSDTGLGQSGLILTYDPRCTVIRQTRLSSASDCRAYKGASGGAVVQLSERGEAWVSGVISQGDGMQTSTFVPIASFRHAITQYLR